jgi:hypothetical protein
MIDLIFRDDMSLKGFETDNPKTPLFLKNQRKRKYMSNGNLEMNSVPKISRKEIGIRNSKLTSNIKFEERDKIDT